MSDKSSESGITTSAVNTRNITITDEAAQLALTGKTTAQTISEIHRENVHQTVTKPNVEQVKADLERDLNISRDFIDNLNKVGDKLYYEVEKNPNNILVKYKPEECTDPSCLRTFDLDMEQLKNRKLTKEEAETLSRMYVHGIFNITDDDRTEGGILYGGSDTLNNASIIVRKPYAGLAEELSYTVFERVRAGLNLPMVFGASNAGRDQVTIWEKLNEYNRENPNDKVDLTHVAHSLGVSSTKNAINWANYQNVGLNNLNANLTALGTSYPIKSDMETGYFDAAKGLFGKARLDYSIAPKDCVGTCLLIGRTPSTAENTKVGRPLADLLLHHTVPYIRDKEVLEFYIKDQSKLNEKINESQKIWNRINKDEFEPKLETLE